MKNLVLFCWILQIGYTFSQIRVVRDPLACAYGLQNQKNEWIVPPRFQQLLYLNDGFYACQFAEKWGLIKENGKQITDEIHDQISIFKPGHFLIVDLIHTENASYKRMGILDTNLRWIIPLEFTSISRMERNHLLLTKRSNDKKGIDQYYSSICDENGNLLFPFQEGWILNTFYLKESLLIGNTILGSHTAQGNVRCINLKGEVISDTTYDFGMPCTESFFIVKHKEKLGLLNTSGKTIIPPKYALEYSSYDYQNPIPCLHGHHQFIFIENEKKGIINGEWKEVIPAKYKSIQTISSNETDYTSARYIAYDNTVQKYHLLDQKGTVLQIADTFASKFVTFPKINYYELDKHKVYFYYGNHFGKDFKWGILNDKGEIILPSNYESIWITSSFEVMQIQTQFDPALPPKVSMLNIIDTAQKSMVNLEFVSKMDSIYLYSSDTKFYPLLYLPSSQKWSNDLYGYQAPYSYGDFIIISGNANAFLIHKKLKTIQKFKIIDIHNGHFPIVYSQEGMNILHPKKGLLFAENQLQINQQFISINRIWVRNNGLWSIYDTLANKRIVEDFDEISYYWESMIVKKNGQYGILNKECQWYTPPVFKDIFQLTEDGFVGLTHTGKVGIINTNSQEKVDTSFHSFIPMSYYSTKQLKYCLIKNQQKYFFDENHQLLQLTEKEIITKSWTNPSEPCYSFYLNPLQNNTSYLSNCEDKLYNILYPFYQLNLKNDKNVVLDGKRGESNNENYNFELTYLNTTKFSIHIFKYQQNRLDNIEKNHVEPIYYSDLSLQDNWLLINGVWKEVKYDHLFNPLDPLFQKAIISAIQQNSALKINCRDPSYLFKGATQFSFEAEGIKLYFFQDQHDAFTLTLNLKELSRIPSAKWVVKYF